MKTFNINDYIYIQITRTGWDYLRNTVGQAYIESCIDNDFYRRNIGEEVWYRVQAHVIFDLLPIKYTPLYNTTIMIEDEFLKANK